MVRKTTRKKKLKSFQGIDKSKFHKTSVAMIDEDYGIPLKALNFLEVLDFECNRDIVRPPIKERPANEEEKAEFLKEGHQGATMLVKKLKVTYVDYADEDYIIEATKQKGNLFLLDKVKYVDMDYMFGEKHFWETIGLKDNKDHIGLIHYLFSGEELQLPESFLETFETCVKGLKGDPILKKLSDIQNLFPDKSEFDILSTITEYMQDKQTKEDELSEGTE